MKSPVNFIALEKELESIGTFLSGRVLNAGCGDRDITSLLKSWKAVSVDNCDIQSSIPGAFLCDLTKIPKPEGSYDSILCNAVLEHVPDPEGVMAEFHRLLGNEGTLVVSVPFLQPFHPTPFDFRRYTWSGLKQLAERNGFQVQHIWSVHSLAQTIGWLIWAHLEERKSRVGKFLCWLPIYLSSRMFQRAPEGQIYTANSFQAVMVKVKAV
jgi:SAM-dependent methyltransferase